MAGDLFAGSDIFFWNFLELPPVQMAGPAGAHSANKKKFTEFGGGGTNIGENTERWGVWSDFYMEILRRTSVYLVTLE